MANVKEIEWQGGIYNIADETARGEAQQAHALANTAQASANAAQTSADNAQTAADNAQTTANAAQTTAGAAQDTADEVSTQFTNYKKLETASATFGAHGSVLFHRRGNVCQISIAESDVAKGIYSVNIPEGFIPVQGTGGGSLPLTWEGKEYGYWMIDGGLVIIRVAESHFIAATHTFII